VCRRTCGPPIRTSTASPPPWPTPSTGTAASAHRNRGRAVGRPVSPGWWGRGSGRGWLRRIGGEHPPAEHGAKLSTALSKFVRGQEPGGGLLQVLGSLRYRPQAQSSVSSGGASAQPLGRAASWSPSLLVRTCARQVASQDRRGSMVSRSPGIDFGRDHARHRAHDSPGTASNNAAWSCRFCRAIVPVLPHGRHRVGV
jgi:hypothetical protein